MTVVENFAGMTMSEVIKMLMALPTPFVYSTTSYLHDCACYRLGAVLIVFHPSLMASSWRALRLLTPERLRNGVKFLGDDQSKLHDGIDPSALPRELGGQLDEEPGAWLEEQIALEQRGL